MTEIKHGWMAYRDPPAHTRLRSLVSNTFTPRMIERMRGRIQAETEALLETVQGAGCMDIIADLAVPLPVTVITDMLGVPVSDRRLFREWSRDLLGLVGMTFSAETALRAAKAAEDFGAYLRTVAKERRAKPKEDLISALVVAEAQGDKLTESEMISTCMFLLVAGHETTATLIGNGLMALLRYPEQMAKLKADSSLLKTGIEELLRYDSPVQVTARFVLEDMTYKGQLLRLGEQVGFILGAANRDPAQFTEPNRLDVTRQDNCHLAFGNGIHYCLAAPLGRLQGQIAVEAVLRRFPNVELADPNPCYRDSWVLRGLRELPVTF
jgi:cytochrome P450